MSIHGTQALDRQRYREAVSTKTLRRVYANEEKGRDGDGCIVVNDIRDTIAAQLINLISYDVL